MKLRLYLDDVRTPIDPEWIVVRSYKEFIEKLMDIGLENFEVISLDHDLGDTAMQEYYSNVSPNYTLNYDNIEEKTGYCCAKWLVDFFYCKNPNWEKMDQFEKKENFKFPTVYTHSANPIGSANIMGYINNFLMNEGHHQTCIRVNIEHY